MSKTDKTQPLKYQGRKPKTLLIEGREEQLVIAGTNAERRLRKTLYKETTSKRRQRDSGFTRKLVRLLNADDGRRLTKRVKRISTDVPLIAADRPSLMMQAA